VGLFPPHMLRFTDSNLRPEVSPVNP